MRTPKYNFSQGGPNLGRERGPENLVKMGNNRDIYCSANRKGGEFRKRISAPTP